MEKRPKDAHDKLQLWCFGCRDLGCGHVDPVAPPRTASTASKLTPSPDDVTPYTPRNMSRRVFGTGIVATGLLVLTIGLILGLEFPKFVYRKSIEDTCILDRTHPKYSIWLKDSYRNKTNMVYYWVLTNKDDFLYGRTRPKVEQRGPYVYTETMEHIGVRYNINKLSFKEWKRQEFDGNATQELCPVCREDDQLTIINSHYLKTVESLEGDRQYSLHRTPDILRQSLITVTSLHAHQPDSMLHTMTLLGSREPDQVDRWSHKLHYPDHFSRLSFGSWLDLNDTDEKHTVLMSRGWQAFSQTEMTGLYQALTNSEVLGVTRNQLVNVSFGESCRTTLTVPNYSTYQLRQAAAMLNSVSYGAITLAGGVQISERPCGLLHCLERYQELSHHPAGDILSNISELSQAVGMYLCPNSTVACFAISQNDRLVQTAMLQVLSEYLLNHLQYYVFHRALSDIGDIVITRSQRDLTLGYGDAGGETVEGVLQHDLTADQAMESAPAIQLLNCYDTVDAQTNGMWIAYQGKEYASPDQFPLVNQERRTIRSHRLSIQPVSNMSACVTARLHQHQYEMFRPEYWRKMLFVRTDSVSFQGVHLDRLSFNATNLEPDGRFVSTSGLQEMTGTNGYLSWSSQPHYLHEDLYHQGDQQNHSQLFMMSPSKENHSSYIDFQPITGKAWRQNMRYQHSAGIRPRDISVRRTQRLHVEYIDQPIPVYWVDKGFVYTQEGVDDYDHRVKRLMKTSCGGLIGLSVVACLVILSGILAATVTIRGGKVAPLQETTTHASF